MVIADRMQWEVCGGWVLGGWAAGRVPHSARVSDTRFATRASSSATAFDAAAVLAVGDSSGGATRE
jgi:hypothetical protein